MADIRSILEHDEDKRDFYIGQLKNEFSFIFKFDALKLTQPHPNLDKYPISE